MNVTSARSATRLGYVCIATATAALLAVVTVTAAYRTFEPAFEGELWRVTHEIASASPNGVVYVGETLFVADDQQRTVTAYDTNGAVIVLQNAEWTPFQADVASSPLNGWAPNQLATAIVQTIVASGQPAIPEQTAILVSDGNATRAMAFNTMGQYLFTIILDRPIVGRPLPEPGSAINGLAMSPGAKFVLNTTNQTLVVQGSFAASWADDFGGGEDGAVLVFRDQSFELKGPLQFYAKPLAELKGTEGTTPGPAAREPYGVTFDTAGNLYTVDAVTERLNVYAPDLTHLFTFGTPAGTGTAEFYQSYGLAFWPDAAGGRLFIADAINKRVAVYRPNLRTKTLNFLFAIDGLGAIKGFPLAVAINPSTATLAIADDFKPRVWILQTPSLAVFDLQVLNNSGNPVEVVCPGVPYQVRFSITVPAGRPEVAGVEPQLTIDGVEWSGAPTAGGNYRGLPLRAGDVATYTYSLTAPGTVGEISFEAGATATAIARADILFRQAVLRVSDCQSAPPTITATPKPPSVGPQLSGWTPVFEGETYTITLYAEDDKGIQRIEYKLTGANQPPVIDPVEYVGAPSRSQSYDVALPEMGATRLEFRAWDNDLFPSPWQVLDLRLVRVGNRWNDEGAAVPPFSVGPPTTGFTYSQTGLPAGLTFNTANGLISGSLSYQSAGVHTVTITESNGVNQSSVAFTWTVYNINVAPVANNDSYSTNEDTAVTVPARGVLVNDTDEDGASLTATLVSGVAHGTLSFNPNGSFGYTPAPDFYGSDSFSYKANDGSSDSNVATVTITVNAVNDAPSFTAGANQSVGEDAGPQSVSGWATGISKGPANESTQTLTFVVVSNSNPGLFQAQPAIASNGTLTYQSGPNAYGGATIAVQLTDSGGTTNGGVNTSATHTFTITVTPINDTPVAVNDSYSTGEDVPLVVAAEEGVLSNDSDADANALTASLVSGPSHGTLVLNADGAFVYTPNLDYSGPDSFSYTASDGALTSSTATVAITVVPTNLPPVCSAAVVPTMTWPSNQKQVYLSLSGIVDPEKGALTVLFTGILQDEPTNAPGSGNTIQDGGIESGGLRAWVRAERMGSPGDGRVYLVSFQATDSLGGTCSGTINVGVPHDKGKGPAVLSPGRWDSQTGLPFVPAP